MKIRIFTITAAFTLILISGIGLIDAHAQQTATGSSEWQSQDVGRVGLNGDHNLEAEIHTVRGSGADIWSGADAFHFAYQLWDGDGEFIARVISVQTTDPWAKAGLMIRATLDENSPHAMVAATPDKGVTFIRRLKSGGLSKDDAHQAMRMVVTEGRGVAFQQRGSAGVDMARDATVSSAQPHWIRLTRHGGVLVATESVDGINWLWLGTVESDLPEQCYVGFAVSSHNNSELCEAVFDQVSFTSTVKSNSSVSSLTGSGDGLTGLYFDTIDHSGIASARLDPQIDFNWGFDAPMDGVGPDRFSVRWEGELEAQFSEPHAFHIVSDDRARLWLDGSLLIDEWYEHAESVSTAIANLIAGKRYLLRLEFYENRAAAVVKLQWSSPSLPRRTIPQAQLYSTISDADEDGLPDLWEQAFGLNPADTSDASRDTNDDGVSNLEHYLDGSDPLEEITVNAELPFPWLSRDVGRVGRSGDAEYSNGNWIVRGSGADIWANADGFHFVYQRLSGDAEIVARLTGQPDTDPWAKSGLMMRENLNGKSRHVMLAVTPDNGIAFHHRHERSGTSAVDSGTAEGVPQWLKLQRRGNAFTAYTSTDGASWSWVGTEAVEMLREIHVGLAVNSHDNSELGTAVFDEVTLTRLPPVRRQRAPAVGTGDGLYASYFDGTSGNSMSRVDPQVNFDWDYGSPVAGIGDDHFSVRWEGWLEAQYDEIHGLHVISDDGARLWLNGELIIDAWQDRGAALSTARVPLKAGQNYAIRMEFFERTREATAKLLWSSPSTPKEPIPKSQLYSTVPPRFVETTPVRKPSDTAKESAQSRAEIPSSTGFKKAGLDTSKSEAATITGYVTVAESQGSDVIATKGWWEIHGDAVYAVDRRGSVEFMLAAPAAGMYRIEVEGTSRNPMDPDRQFQLLLSVDGEYLGRSYLDAGRGPVGIVHSLTPWLKSGDHRITVEWDNARKGRSLQIEAVRLQTLLGADSNEDGVIDWIENKLTRDNGIEVTSNSTTSQSSETIYSIISPACIEGRGAYLSMMSITAGGEEVTARHGIRDRWYADVPLPAVGITKLEVSFQNGGFKDGSQLVWTPVNVLESDDITLRKGDSLLLTARPVAPGNTPEGTVQITVGNSTLLSTSGPLEYRFDQTGEHTVTGTFTGPNGKQMTRTITVHVVGAAFNGNPVAWPTRERMWNCPELPAEAVIEADPRIRLSEITAESEENSRVFRLNIDAPEIRYVLARTEKSGPILTSAAINGVGIFGISEAGAFYGEQYEDGSRLVETAVVQTRIFPDVYLQMNIIVGGVMFDDGSLVKTLRAEDFDEIGLVNVYFIMPPGVQTSNCHVMKAYQGETFIGEY